MEVQYNLDRGKFNKIYNELKTNNGISLDTYGLIEKYDITRIHSCLKDVKYAIDNNFIFKVTDIPTIKAIEDMYALYNNPDKITGKDIDLIIHNLFKLEPKFLRFDAFVHDISITKHQGLVKVNCLLKVFIHQFEQYVNVTKDVTCLDEIVDELVLLRDHNNKMYQGTAKEQPKSFIHDLLVGFGLVK